MNEKVKQILDSNFWEKAWEEAGKLRRKKTGVKSGTEESARWNRRAGYFESRVNSTDGSARVKEIIKFLHDEGALSPQMKVLDVGCGNGSITVSLAAAAAEVYALDPAEKMLTLLQKKIEEKKIHNIYMEKARWQDINLEEKGWLDFFDLSFASMSPGVNNAFTLQKLIASSKKYCYLSTFAGRNDRVRKDIWERVTGKPFVTGDLDIIYPFNLLYTWGFRPSLRFHRHYRRDRLSPQDAVVELMQYAVTAGGEGESAKNAVEKYVEENLENGFFLFELEVYHGMLLWDKTLKASDIK